MAKRSKRPAPGMTDVAAALKERQGKVKLGEGDMWRTRMAIATEVRDKRAIKYDSNERAYYGELFTESERKMAVAAQSFLYECNLALPTISAQRQRVVPRIPWHSLEPTREISPLDEARMRTAEMTLNFFFRHPLMNYASRMNQIHLMGELGLGACEVYFSPDEGEDPERDRSEETGKIEADIDPETGLDTLESPSGDPLMTDDGEFVQRGRGKIVIDTRNPLEYFGTRNYHWNQMLVDPEGDEDPTSLGWISTNFSMRLDDALRNKAFNKATKEEIRSAGKSVLERLKDKRSMIRRSPIGAEYGAPSNASTYGASPEDEDFIRITGQRIWDARKRTCIYMVDGMQDVAGKLDYPGWVGHSPITFYKLEDKIGSFYPQTAFEHGLPYLQAYARFWATLMNHLKRFKRKYGATPTAFVTEEQESHLLDPTDGLVVKLRDKNALWPIEDAYLDPSIYQMMERAEQNWYRIMGSAAEFLGVPGSDSATQASIIDRRGVGREDEKRVRLINCFQEVSNKMLANIQANLPTPIAVRIAGEDGQMWKKIVGRADLGGIGLYETVINISEMQPYSLQGQFQSLMGFLQILGPDAFAASPDFTEEFFKSGLIHNPVIAKQFTEYATLMLAQRMAGGGGAENGNGGGKSGESKGGYKPTGQGVEGGATTAGRSAGREQRQAPNTLLGPGNTPPPGGQ